MKVGLILMLFLSVLIYITLMAILYGLETHFERKELKRQIEELDIQTRKIKQKRCQL